MGSTESASTTSCFCATTRRAARMITRMYDRALTPSGVTAGQFEILSNIRGRQSVDQQALVAAIGSDQTTLSRNLKVMLELGWIERARDGADRRQNRYRLTRGGAATLRQAQGLWEQAQAEMQGRLGGSSNRALQVLREIATAAGSGGDALPGGS
jgi:DNA-binding MarR family transcriptional regulator